MKVEKKQDPSTFLATYWNLSQKSGDLETSFFPKSSEFGPTFFMENPLHRSKAYFSGRNLAKFRPEKNTDSTLGTEAELLFSLVVKSGLVPKRD
jgi:hypothetical protein